MGTINIFDFFVRFKKERRRIIVVEQKVIQRFL
jgi:hypothetical protein